MENDSNDDKTTPSASCHVNLQRRKYNWAYYHLHKASVTCEYCEKEYSCKSGLVRHQKRSSKCEVKKLQKYIIGLEGNLPCGISFKEIVTHILSKLEMA